MTTGAGSGALRLTMSGVLPLLLAVPLLLCSAGVAAQHPSGSMVGSTGGGSVGDSTTLVKTAQSVSAGDPEKGRQLYARCAACHSLAVDRTGPRHCGLLGRRAGSVPGFAYSEAMRNAGVVWTVATLDRFLANPMKAMPGTAMGYAGVDDRLERADLVAFLARASSSEACAKGR